MQALNQKSEVQVPLVEGPVYLALPQKKKKFFHHILGKGIKLSVLGDLAQLPSGYLQALVITTTMVENLKSN